MRKLLCFILLAVLTGCSGMGVAFDPVSLRSGAPDEAEVVIIRDLTRFALQPGKASDRWVVGMDGRNFGELLPGQYTTFSVPTEKGHSMEVRRWDVWWHRNSVPVILEPGKRYYFLVGVFDLYSAGISPISEEQGRAWVAKSQYVQVRKAM